MSHIDTAISLALVNFMELIPETNTEWILLKRIGPLDIFVRWFEKGSVEFDEKINNITYTSYIKSI